MAATPAMAQRAAAPAPWHGRDAAPTRVASRG